jgi:hypothetical protein
VILIKDTITYYEQLKYEEEAIQATSIQVQGLIHEITIAAVYCPPQPPFGTTAPTNAQQKTKTEMDLRSERLRWHRWKPT